MKKRLISTMAMLPLIILAGCGSSSYSGHSDHWNVKYTVTSEKNEYGDKRMVENFRIAYKGDTSDFRMGRILLGGDGSETICGTLRGEVRVPEDGVIEYSRGCTVYNKDLKQKAIYIYWEGPTNWEGATNGERIILK